MPVLKNGTLLGDYTIVGLIARGGMGEVYEAHENKLDRRVALKVILHNTSEHESEDLVRRFMQEARTLAKVNHPNVVTVHSIQSVDNLQFIAMEYVEGVSLKQFLDEYTIPIEIALFLFEQILSGIKRLHDHGIVHRDLKPSNILIRVDGQIKILDFGIAKSSDALHNTNPGVTVGTPPYMAPEMRSFRGSTSRSDFWSLGAIFFEALTGKLLVMFIEDDQFKFQAADLKLIPPEMRAIINGMSAPEPDDRYKSAAEILDDLHVLRQSVGQATPAALAMFRDQLRHLVDSKRAKEKSAIKQIMVPKFDIEVDTRGSERMESSIRMLDKMPRHTQTRRPKTPESRSSKRKRHNRNLLWAALAGIIAAGIYISPIFDRYAIRGSLRAVQGVPPNPLKLLEPADRQQVWLEPTQNPTLSWSRVLAAQEYDIQIALDPDFKRIVLNEPVNGNSYVPIKALAEGPYYWRLLPALSNRRATPLQSQAFTLNRLEPVVLVKPLAGEKVETLTSDGGPTDFEWACRMGARQYNVQVSADAGFKRIAASNFVSDCRWTGVRLKPGRYYWRVRLELGPGYREVWSVSRPFAVVSGAPRVKELKTVQVLQLPAPRLKNPKQQLFFALPARRGPAVSRGVEKIVELSWKPIPGVRQYHVQVSYFKDMAGPVVDENVVGSTYKWKASVAGTFYWRVRAVTADGNSGPPSTLGEVSMLLPAPALQPAFNFTLPDSPTVEWKPSPITPMYLIQSSTKKELATVRVKTAMEPRYTLPAAPGRYYVRVASADINGLPTSPYSNITAIRVAAQVRTPTSVSISAPKLVAPMSGAAAPSKAGGISIEFQWTSVPKAESYSLQLAADAGFTQIVERSNSGEAKALLEQLDVQGRVYWRVKANGGGKSSPWSESFYFDVK